MSKKQIDALFRKIVQNDAEEESRKLVEQRSENPGKAVPELSRARLEKMLDRELADSPSKKEKEHRIGLSKTAKNCRRRKKSFTDYPTYRRDIGLSGNRMRSGSSFGIRRARKNCLILMS